MLRKYIRNIPASVRWLIFIALGVILPFLPIPEFAAGMMAGMVIMIFAYIIPKKEEVYRILKKKEEDEIVDE